MRHILFFVLLLAGFGLQAQSVPGGMTYQAVARDLAGNIVPNQTLGVQISLAADAAEGKMVYQETHQVSTDKLGLFTIVIGEGQVASDRTSLNDVPWSESEIWMNLAVDMTGGSDYQQLSSTRLLTVPYAFHAGSADRVIGAENEEGTNKNGPQFYWSVSGNLYTVPGIQFIGTRDFRDLLLKTNNIERIRITAAGDIIMTGDVTINGNLTVTENADIGIDLTVGNDASVGNDLDVTNNTNIGVDLTVGNDASVGNDLDVTNNTNVGVDLTVGNDASVGNNLDVTNDANIGGDLGVAGDGSFFNLNVTNNTTTGNDLSVGNDATVGNDISVGNNATVAGDLNVTGDETVGGNSSVIGNEIIGGNSNVSGNLSVSGTTTSSGAVNANGRLLATGASGSPFSTASYPVHVYGSNQGIAISVNESRDGDNHFVSFFDPNGMQGRIEGQNATDLLTDPEYIFNTAIFTAEVVAAGVNIGLSLLPNGCAGVGVVACPPEPSVVAIAIAEEILAVANLAAYQAFAFAQLGVTYQSGAGDYAEWLERSVPGERFVQGDIVAVSGGKITKNTATADKFMVISTNPIVLGNMPDASEQEDYEMVAFMGQIPVKVRGQVRIGDYILPSGLNDGTGIAVAKDALTLEQYAQIVGVAWTASVDGSAVSLINVAVGLNDNDLVRMAQQQQDQIEALEDKYATLEARLLALESGQTVVPTAPASPVFLPEAEMVEVDPIELEPVSIDQEAIENAILLLEDEYRAQGIDVDNHVGLQKLFNDKEFRQNVIQEVETRYNESTRQTIQKFKQRN